MIKKLKKSPANKCICGSPPAFVHNSNDLFHSTCDATRAKFVTVNIVTSCPLIDYDKYSENYEEIDWGKK